MTESIIEAARTLISAIDRDIIALLAERMEAPVWDENTGEFYFDVFHVREVKTEN